MKYTTEGIIYMLTQRHKVSTDDEAVAADDNYLRLFQPVQ